MEGSEAQPETQASIDRAVEWVDTDASGHQHNSAIRLRQHAPALDPESSLRARTGQLGWTVWLSSIEQP
jgi:hypothetical protein